MSLSRAALAASLLCLVVGCRPATPAGTSQPAAAGAPVVAVATIFPLADLTRQLAGDAVEVETLVRSGVSPHTFEITSAQARAVADARVIVKVGVGLDDWLDKLLSGSSARIVTALEVTETIRPAAEDQHHEEHGKQLEADPHVWLDPVRMRDDIGPAIADALAQTLPEHAAEFGRRLGELQARLTTLDAELRQQFAALPVKRYIAAHSAWGYFNQRYGLELAAAVEEVPGADPSAAWLKHVVETAKSAGVTVVFTEAQVSDAFAKTVAGEAHLRIGTLDPLGGEEVPSRNSYEALLRWNAAQMTAALRAGGSGS